MKKWLRWQGLIVFGVVSCIIFIFCIFLVDSIVKRYIEKAGTLVVGAKVELADADMRLFPPGLTLTNLQVTNPDSPMSNAVEAGRIDFSPDVLNLLKRKIIIDTMAIEGVRFNTSRSASGAVVSQKQEKAPSGTQPDSPSAAPGLPSIQVPDIKDILDREKLESLDQAQKLQKEIDAARVVWQNRLADAPDQKTFEQYQARAEKLQKDAKGLSGALTIAQDLKKLQNDVSKDLEELSALQMDFKQDTSTLKKKLDQLKSAPQQDIDRILNTYNLSANGLGNFSQLLFGDKITGRVQKAIFWYGKLKPFLEKAGPSDKKGVEVAPDRSQGVNVRFKEEDPLPDLLAKLVHVSMIIPAGNMEGKIQQLTSDQQLLGMPLEFNFSGDSLEGIQSIIIKGTLDHIHPNNSRDRVTVAVKQYRIKDLNLSESEDLPIVLKNGLAHLNLFASLQEDMLDVDVKLILDAVALESGKEVDGNQFQQALHNALADVSSFSINAEVSGPLDNYNVKITSDLDRVLRNAIGKQIKDLSDEFQDKLRAGIQDKFKGPLGEATGSMSGLDNINQEIASRMKLGDDVSNSLIKGLGGKSKIKF
jgi:uncharacterized protein (TIGR03545 family)